MSPRACLALLAMLLANSIGMAGHHFFNALYFEGQRLTPEGAVTRWSYRNPHAELVVMVRAGPATGEWTVEWDGALHLAKTGVAADTLRTGQRVVVTGSPGRAPGTRRLRLRTIVRPADGWAWPSESVAR